ncbi:MAG: hypothetical protein HUU32_03290 [Calditrichaceae bacterium]|nr:hypothetical protein [Calditrichia bacterium]NUQ40404.1 hypothetical protein [Calditrichaceae bacterium]
MNLVNQQKIQEFFARLDEAFGRPARVYLIGETTQVWEGWQEWTAQIEFSAEIAPEKRPAFDTALETVQKALGLEALEEHPGDLIPLPQGHRDRARPAGAQTGKRLEIYHFDPYSAAFRFIARGDEPDYHLVLAYLDRGWITEAQMDALLTELLPKFSMQTIQQDPAEFRRKYKGLKQMWRARVGV